MPSQPTPPPPADRAYWTHRLQVAQHEVQQLRDRIEEHHRRSSRPNLHLLQVWQDSLAHWQKAEAEARQQIARCPADPEALRWMKS